LLVNKSSVRSDISVTAGEAGGSHKKRRRQNPVGMTHNSMERRIGERERCERCERVREVRGARRERDVRNVRDVKRER